MARYLQFDRVLYGSNGNIPLTRGDDWSLTGTVVQLNGANVDPVDLTGNSGLTAYFPGITGSVLVGTISVPTPACGRVVLGLPASASINALLTSAGVTPYVQLRDSAGLHTLFSIDPQPLVISDPGFIQM